MSHDLVRVVTDGHCLQRSHRYDLTQTGSGSSSGRTARHLTHSTQARQAHWSSPAAQSPSSPPLPEAGRPTAGPAGPVRRRFWGETVTAVVATTLAGWLLTAPNQVERMTGQSLHDGATASDWAYVAFVTLIAAISTSVAAGEWRRPRR